jgi:hypothetical protein
MRKGKKTAEHVGNGSQTFDSDVMSVWWRWRLPDNYCEFSKRLAGAPCDEGEMERRLRKMVTTGDMEEREVDGRRYYRPSITHRICLIMILLSQRNLPG